MVWCWHHRIAVNGIVATAYISLLASTRSCNVFYRAGSNNDHLLNAAPDIIAYGSMSFVVGATSYARNINNNNIMA